MFLKFLFLSSALATLTGSVLVVFAKDIMHSCIYLFLALLGVAGLYLTLNADFVAATQLVVYVGGVVILMLFATMLTGGSSNQAHNKFGFKKIPIMGSKETYIVGLISAFLFLVIISKLLLNLKGTITPLAGEMPFETVRLIGHKLVTDHVLPFEVSSVLLLGALVGAAMIARPRRG